MHLLCCNSGCRRCCDESCEYEVLVKVVNMRICWQPSVSQLGGVVAVSFHSVGKAVDSVCDPRVNVHLTP